MAVVAYFARPLSRTPREASISSQVHTERQTYLRSAITRPGLDFLNIASTSVINSLQRDWNLEQLCKCNVLRIATKFSAESEGLEVMILWAGDGRDEIILPETGDRSYTRVQQHPVQSYAGRYHHGFWLICSCALGGGKLCSSSR